MTFFCKLCRILFCCCLCSGCLCPGRNRRKRKGESLPLLANAPRNSNSSFGQSAMKPVEPKNPPPKVVHIYHQRPIPQTPALEDFSLIGIKNGYFVYGGAVNETKVDKSIVQNTLYFYDPYTPSFHVLDDSPSMIHGRYGHTSFLRKNRYLIIFGGLTQVKNHEYDPNLYEYDIINKKWTVTKFRPMFSKTMSSEDIKIGIDDLYRQNQPKNAAPRLFHHTALYASYKDEMYVFGGRSGTYTQLNKLFRYSFQEERWKELVFLKKAEIPEARDRHSMNWIDSFQTEFLVFGGMTSSFAPTNDTWLFSLPEKKWSRADCHGPPPSPRYSHGSVVHNRRLYIYGGENVSDMHNDMFELNLITYEWKQYEIPNRSTVRSHHKISFFRNNHGHWRMLSVGGCDRRKTVGQSLELAFQDGCEETRRKRFLFLIGGAFFDTELHLPLKGERIRCFRSLFASSILRLQDINQITLSQNNLMLREDLMLSVLLGMDEIRGTFLSLDGSQNPVRNNSNSRSNNRRRRGGSQSKNPDSVKEDETIVVDLHHDSPIQKQQTEKEEVEGEEDDDDEQDIEHKKDEEIPTIVVDNEISSDDGEQDDEEIDIEAETYDHNNINEEQIDNEFIIQPSQRIMELSNGSLLESEDRTLYPPGIYFFDLFLFFGQFEMPVYMDFVLQRVRQLRHIPTLLKLFQRSLNETKRRKKLANDRNQNREQKNNQNGNHEKQPKLTFKGFIDMEIVAQSKFSIAVFEAIKEQYPAIRRHSPYQDFLRNLNYFEEMEDFLLHQGSLSPTMKNQDGKNENSPMDIQFAKISSSRHKKKKSQDGRSDSVRSFKGNSREEENYNNHNNIRPKGFFDLFMWNCRVLYEQKFKYFNVKLSTSEGFEYVAHMEVLIMRSQYFYELFRKNIRRVRERKFGAHVLVRVKEITSGELQLLLQWIYLDEIKSEEMRRLFMLLRFAEQYQEIELRNFLVDRITEIIVREGKSYLKKQIIKKLGYFFKSGLLSEQTTNGFLQVWENTFKISRKKILKGLKVSRKRMKE